MAFTFSKYGTFTGPTVEIEYRDNDDFSVDPFDGYFNLDDVSMVLANTTSSPADYVYMHLNGSNTSNVTLERNTGPIPTFNVEADQTNFSGSVTAPSFNGTFFGNATSAKGLSPGPAFDVPHLTKPGKRVRHIVAEGPEAGIYIRGQLKDSNIIELPEYWDRFVDPESITVTLTQIGYSQDLIVDRIEWGKKVIIRSGLGANINCYYEVWAARWLNPLDHNEKLHVVYDGKTPDDYPGDNSRFLVGGWDYDRRDPKTGERVDTGT